MPLPPGLPNLRDVMLEIASAQSGINTVQGATSKVNEENQQMYQQAVDAAGVLGQLAQQQQVIDAGQELKFEQRKAAVADAFGTDILNPDNRIALLAREREAATNEALARASHGQDLVDTGLFQDPLSYMLARPFAHREFQAATAAQNKVKVIDSAIQNLNQDTQQSIQTQKAINVQYTAEEAEIAGQVKALEAAELVRKAQFVKNDAALKGLNAVQDLTEEHVKWTIEAYKLNLTNEQWLEVKERRQAMRQAKLDEKLAMNQMMEIYNVGAKRLGKPEFQDVAEFGVAMKNPALNKGLAATIDFGMPYATLPSDTPTVFAGTAGEAAVTIETLNGRLPSTATKTSTFLTNQSAFAIEDLKKNTPAGKKLTLDDKASAINSRVYTQAVLDKDGKPIKGKKQVGVLEQMIGNAEQDLDGGRTTNIYKAPAPSVIASTNAAVTRNRLWKEVVEPLATSVPNPTANQILKSTQLAVAEGKAKPEEAAAFIASYYATANFVNNSTEQYSSVGLPKPQGYKVLVDNPFPSIGHVIGNKPPVQLDMTNEAAITRMMLYSYKQNQLPSLLR